MKIFINDAGENWICDRVKNEFQKCFTRNSTSRLKEADLFWAIAPWKIRNFSSLQDTPTLSSIYHITPSKFNKNRLLHLNEYSDAFHVICNQTKEFISEYVTKPIYVAPFWVNQAIFYPLDKDECRSELNLPSDKFIIGSFQRDTEGAGRNRPKLEKGPDQFCDVIENIAQDREVHVLLGGWRRSYVISRLDAAGIPYSYIQRPQIEVINKMYNCLDLYIVASRYEGGPQSIPESCATKTPIISTNVGCAPMYLDDSRVYEFPNYKAALNSDPRLDFHFKQAQLKFIPQGANDYFNFFEKILSEFKY